MPKGHAVTEQVKMAILKEYEDTPFETVLANRYGLDKKTVVLIVKNAAAKSETDIPP